MRSFCGMLVRLFDVSLDYLWRHNGWLSGSILVVDSLFVPSFPFCQVASSPFGPVDCFGGRAVAAGDRHTGMPGLAMICVGLQALTNRNT